jgi:hypothetical protein
MFKPDFMHDSIQRRRAYAGQYFIGIIKVFESIKELKYFFTVLSKNQTLATFGAMIF